MRLFTALAAVFLMATAQGEETDRRPMAGVDGKLKFFHSGMHGGMALGKVSGDPSYGTSCENPVKVGAEFKGAQVYLSSLYGPGGEEVNFRLEGFACNSDPVRSSIVIVSFLAACPGEKNPVRLYLDVKNQAELFIPAGFSNPPGAPTPAPARASGPDSLNTELTEAVVRRQFDRYGGMINQTYTHARRSDPSLQGKLEIDLNIARDGAVTGCTPTSKTTLNAEFAKRMAARICQIQFPASANGLRSTYSFDFQP